MRAQDFINLGGKMWEKGTIKRVYINATQFNKLTGAAFSDNNNKFFFDCETNCLMRSYKGKAPQVEAQY